MKIGDIYVNKYASEDNPSRIFIITAINAKYVYGKYAYKGELRSCRHYKTMRNDTEHYEKIGHFNYIKYISEKLLESANQIAKEMLEGG